jgi:membrane protease YdiL (CAAX protease family)
MARNDKHKNPQEGLQLWKVIGVFALVFTAVQLAMSALDVSINYLMRLINAGENLRVFVGSTISQIGMIAAILAITVPVIRSVLNKPGLEGIYPRGKRAWLDMLAGMGITAAAMIIIFLIELALGWISVTGFALSGQPTGVILRVAWLALLLKLVTAVMEEVLFRGLLLQGVKEAWDEWGAIFISAVIFGGSHIVEAGAMESDWLKFIPLMALPGVMLGWAYLHTGNLWLATGINFAWNLFQDNLLNLTGFHPGKTSLGLLTEVTGPQLLVGSSSGIEVGMVGILCLVLIAIGIWFWTIRKGNHDTGGNG